MRVLLRYLTSAALALMTPQLSAHAQIGFEPAVANINDVNIFFNCWSPRGEVVSRSSCPSARNGFGIEVLYTVGRVGVLGSPSNPAEEGRELSAVTVKCGAGGCDSTKTYTVTRSKATPKRYVNFEMGLGYGQFSGFGSSDETLKLRGTVREVPSVTLYGTFQDETHPLFKTLNPYVGVRSGLLQLSNVSLYDKSAGDTLIVYSGSAAAFQLGIAAGIQVNIGDRAHLFYEVGQSYRRFPNVQWAATGSARNRDVFPETLDFSGQSQSVGVQLTVKPWKP